MYTPGHTDDSYSFASGSRVHRRHAADSRHRAHRLPERRRAGAVKVAVRPAAALPDETLVFPAHDYKGDTVSTIAEERRFNPRLQVKSAEEYVALMNSLNLANPKMMDVAVPANMHQGLHQEEVARRGWAFAAEQALGLLGRAGRRADRPARKARARTARRASPAPCTRPTPTCGEHRRGRRAARAGARPARRLLFYCAFGERSAMAVQAAQDGLTRPATSRAASPPGPGGRRAIGKRAAAAAYVRRASR